ncbi:hypothetical protein GCM10010172_76740 [Paractinoplanes ferrugineus]|uniref:Uncharacterized protein n=1 Tax=Paractinoplanes ferrugineus TaxID=113564 RepID=A0A919JAT6_9ACTN|nr:hypothetical protein [Actinoplanes ferrugineus]GIE16432.1 hypothetical protein Afe05nite_82720 [Actinoplanes ferrugineus]
MTDDRLVVHRFEPYADHLAFVVSDGKLTVTGATELPDEVEPLPLPPGRYRVRVVYMPTPRRPKKYDPEDEGDHIEYHFSMWPVSQEAGVRVIKQGPSPWAY